MKTTDCTPDVVCQKPNAKRVPAPDPRTQRAHAQARTGNRPHPVPACCGAQSPSPAAVPPGGSPPPIPAATPRCRPGIGKALHDPPQAPSTQRGQWPLHEVRFCWRSIGLRVDSLVAVAGVEPRCRIVKPSRCRSCRRAHSARLSMLPGAPWIGWLFADDLSAPASGPGCPGLRRGRPGQLPRVAHGFPRRRGIQQRRRLQPALPHHAGSGGGAPAPLPLGYALIALR